MTTSIQIDTNTLKDLLKSGSVPNLIDVRSPEEFADGSIDGAINVPMDTLGPVLNNYAQDDEIVFVCAIGKRSKQAATFAQSVGFENVHSLDGGMHTWLGKGW